MRRGLGLGLGLGLGIGMKTTQSDTIGNKSRTVIWIDFEPLCMPILGRSGQFGTIPKVLGLTVPEIEKSPFSK